MTPEIVKALTERMGSECHTARAKAGQKLAWKFAKFTLGRGKNSKRESRAYAVYVNENGMTVDSSGKILNTDFKKLPVLRVLGPPAPVRGIWIKMRGALRPPPNTTRPIEKSSQSIDLDHTCDDKEMFEDWTNFTVDMLKFTRDDRCRALVEQVQEHDYFTDDFRDLCERDAESAIQQLIFAHDDANNSSQNPTRYWNANRTIFRERKEDGALMRVSPRDEQTLSVPFFDPMHEDGPFEGKPMIRNFLETNKKFWELNLMRINLPKRGSVVEPYEYGRLNSGGVASVQIDIYGMYERIDGAKRQIGISLANTGVTMLNNGPSADRESSQPDVMDLLMGNAKRQRQDSPAVNKRSRLINIEEEVESDNE